MIRRLWQLQRQPFGFCGRSHRTLYHRLLTSSSASAFLRSDSSVSMSAYLASSALHLRISHSLQRGYATIFNFTSSCSYYIFKGLLFLTPAIASSSAVRFTRSFPDHQCGQSVISGGWAGLTSPIRRWLQEAMAPHNSFLTPLARRLSLPTSLGSARRGLDKHFRQALGHQICCDDVWAWLYILSFVELLSSLAFFEAPVNYPLREGRLDRELRSALVVCCC